MCPLLWKKSPNIEVKVLNWEKTFNKLNTLLRTGMNIYCGFCSILLSLAFIFYTYDFIRKKLNEIVMLLFETVLKLGNVCILSL